MTTHWSCGNTFLGHKEGGYPECLRDGSSFFRLLPGEDYQEDELKEEHELGAFRSFTVIIWGELGIVHGIDAFHGARRLPQFLFRPECAR